MSFRLNTGMVNDKGEKVFISNNGMVDFKDEDELYFYLFRNTPKLAMKARENNWHCTIEKDGVPFTDTDLNDYVERINLSADEMEEERKKRIKMLKLEEMAEKDAITNKTFWISENTGYPFNVNYFLDGYSYEEEVKRAIEKIKSYGGLPYFAIVDHLKSGGLWISVLYVSLYKNEWRYERPDSNGIVVAGVYNTEFDDVDIGSIQIRLDAFAGSVRRIA